MILGFQPIQSGELNFLDISNDGLKLSENPRKSANEFWTELEAKAKLLTKNQKSNKK